MISDQVGLIKDEYREEYERPLHAFNTSLFKMLSTDWEKQQMDSNLFPGRMSDEELKEIIPYVIWTSEFDMYRRDCLEFAKRGRKFDKLLDIGDMPGVNHGYQGMNFDSKETK